jgi:glycosyltransferase involved in cell wall biosynthesis
MKLPLVSVIMPSYNHAEYVEQAIESVLRQRNIDFEFLITDDGSLDRTREKIASIKDKRIKFFPYTINRGASIANNDLVQRAAGQYIALINSDDYWSNSDKLANQVEIMQQNPELGACFGKANFVDKFGKSIKKSQLSFGHVFEKENRSQALWLRYFFDHGNCLCHPTILIRKSCYNDVGLYNNRLRQLPDFDMWIRLVKKYPIYISDHELINFRVLPGENASSETNENSIRTINEHYLIAESFFNGVTPSQLVEGFSDYLVHKDIPTNEHIDIEKTLLYFHENQWLGRPYKIIGLHKMFQLLKSDKHYECLVKEYNINDRWFQQKMGEIDILSKPSMDINKLLKKQRTFFNRLHVFLTKNKQIT